MMFAFIRGETRSSGEIGINNMENLFGDNYNSLHVGAPVLISDAPATPLICPRLQQRCISLLRSLNPFDGLQGQFPVESFNAFNHANPATLGTGTPTTSFGSATPVREPRRTQPGLKLILLSRAARRG